eukprot:947133-Pyramimonas_sp.AAC.1
MALRERLIAWLPLSEKSLEPKQRRGRCWRARVARHGLPPPAHSPTGAPHGLAEAILDPSLGGYQSNLITRYQTA